MKALVYHGPGDMRVEEWDTPEPKEGAATILYVVSLSVIGFYIATFIYLTFSILFLYGGDKSKTVQALLVAAGMDAAVYVIIDLIFQIHMP